MFVLDIEYSSTIFPDKVYSNDTLMFLHHDEYFDKKITSELYKIDTANKLNFSCLLQDNGKIVNSLHVWQNIDIFKDWYDQKKNKILELTDINEFNPMTDFMSGYPFKMLNVRKDVEKIISVYEEKLSEYDDMIEFLRENQKKIIKMSDKEFSKYF